MDNQKSTEGKGSDASRDSAGSSIGKSQDSSLSKGSSGASGSSLGSGASGGSLGGSNATPGSASGATSTSTGAVGGTSNAGTGSSLGSSAAGSSGSMGTSTGSSNMSSSGNSGLGTSGSTTGSSSGTTMGSSGAMGGASGQTTGTEQQQGGIKGMMSSVTPDRVHQSIDKAAQAAQPMVDRLVSSAHAGVDRVSGLLSNAQQTMGERSHQLSEKYSDLSAQGREYVRNNPGSALLAAIGVGFVLAKLLSGSSDRREYRSYRSDYRDY